MKISWVSRTPLVQDPRNIGMLICNLELQQVPTKVNKKVRFLCRSLSENTFTPYVVNPWTLRIIQTNVNLHLVIILSWHFAEVRPRETIQLWLTLWFSGLTTKPNMESISTLLMETGVFMLWFPSNTSDSMNSAKIPIMKNRNELYAGEAPDA